MSALKPGGIDAMAQAAYEEHSQVTPWGSLVPHLKARWRRSIIAAWNRRAGDDEVAKAHGYLTRNVLQAIHPECEPLPDLLGLCTQIDNMVTEIPRLRAELAAAREALKPFASATVLPTGAVIGLERSWFDAARTALGDTP